MFSSSVPGNNSTGTGDVQNISTLYDVEECAPLISPSDSEDCRSFGLKDGQGAAWCWQYIQELVGLLLYAADVTLHVLLLKVLISSSDPWQIASVSVAVAAPHVLVAVLLMVRNGWLSTGWQYCPMVFSLQPLEGLWDPSQGLCGLLVASITVMVYIFLCLIGLAFLSYCLLCYLATALVFSLLVLDLLMLAGTLVTCKQFFRPTELIYIENYRVTRLVVEAWLESLPVSVVVVVSMVRGSFPVLGPPYGVAGEGVWQDPVCAWLPVAALFVSVLNIVDKGCLLKRGTRLSGTSFGTYLGEVLLVKGAVKVPQPFLSQALSDMILQDGVLRVGDDDVMADEDDNGSAALVPSYLLPADGGRLVQGQMLNVVRAALHMHGGYNIAPAGPCTTPSPPPSPYAQCIKEWLIEYPFGRRHCSVVLAEGLTHLPKLERLTVHNCKLGGAGFGRVGELWQLHGGLREVNLVNVDISAQAGQVLAQVIRHNASMALLEISRSSIPSPAVVSIAEALSVNTSILHLNLAADGINFVGLRALCDMMLINTHLTHVNLAFNPFGTEGGAALAEVVERTSCLRHLALALDGMGPVGARHVVDAVQKVSGSPSSLSLTCHDPLHSVVQVQGLPDLSFVCMADYDALISENWLMDLHPHYSLHPHGTHPLLAQPNLMLNQPNSTHSHQNSALSQPGSTHGQQNSVLNPPGSTHGQQNSASSQAGTTHSQLNVLTGQQGALQNQQAQSSGGEGRAQTQARGEGGLSQTLAGPSGAEVGEKPPLGRAARQVPCKVHLLCYEDAIRELALAPRFISGLRALDFTDLGLDDVSTPVLAQAAEDSPCLEELHLAGNRIGDGGAVALATLLDCCRTLSHMDLSRNCLGDVGAMALADAAMTHSRFAYLGLQHNESPLSWGALHHLQAAVGTRQTAGGASLEVDIRDYTPPGAAPLDVSTGVNSPGNRPSHGSAGGRSSSGGDSPCGICFDSSDTVAVHPCTHRVCVGCYKELQRLGQPQSRVLCPFCRGPILGYRYLKMPLPLPKDEHAS